MKKRDKLYKVCAYEIIRGGNHEDIKRPLFVVYEHAYSSKQAIGYVKNKHPRLRSGYDDDYGSESVDYIFDVELIERACDIHDPKKVVQLNLFDFIDNKD